MKIDNTVAAIGTGGASGRGRASAAAHALDALKYSWGEAYEIGWDEKRAYHARRLDNIGGLITAPGPDELRQAIWDDYALKPLPRDLPPPAADS